MFLLTFLIVTDWRMCQRYSIMSRYVWSATFEVDLWLKNMCINPLAVSDKATSKNPCSSWNSWVAKIRNLNVKYKVFLFLEEQGYFECVGSLELTIKSYFQATKFTESFNIYKNLKSEQWNLNTNNSSEIIDICAHSQCCSEIKHLR